MRRIRSYTIRRPIPRVTFEGIYEQPGDEWTGTGSESYAMINEWPRGISASPAHLDPRSLEREMHACTCVCLCRRQRASQWVLAEPTSMWINRSNNCFRESPRNSCRTLWELTARSGCPRNLILHFRFPTRLNMQPHSLLSRNCFFLKLTADPFEKSNIVVNISKWLAL